MKLRLFLLAGVSAVILSTLLFFQNCAAPMPDVGNLSSLGKCSASQIDYLGSCVEKVMSCSIANGQGEQQFDETVGNYAACGAKVCNANYHVESSLCAADVRACTVSGGNGSQTWNGTAYGACVASMCAAGNHVENGACLPDVKACTIANGTGSQTWNGTTYGACVATACNATFHLANNVCNGPMNTVYRAFQSGNGHYWNTQAVAPAGYGVEGPSFLLHATAQANSALLQTCRTTIAGRIAVPGPYIVRSGGCVGTDVAGPVLGYVPLTQFTGSSPLYSCITIGTNNRYMTTKSIAECNQGLPVSILGFVF